MNFKTSNPYLHPDFFCSVLRYDPEYMHRPSSLLYPLALPYDLSDSYLGTATDQVKPVLNAGLEGITSGFMPPTRDPLDRFLAGKREFLEKSVQDILGQIEERQNIKSENLKQIDYDWCYAKTRLYEIDIWGTGRSSNIDRIRTNIHRDLTNFQRERRMEEVACWRDMTRLRTELREALKELEREKSRDSLISGDSS